MTGLVSTKPLLPDPHIVRITPELPFSGKGNLFVISRTACLQNKYDKNKKAGTDKECHVEIINIHQMKG